MAVDKCGLSMRVTKFKSLNSKLDAHQLIHNRMDAAGQCEDVQVPGHKSRGVALVLQTALGEEMFLGQPRHLINELPPLNRDYNRDPLIVRPSKGGALLIMGLQTLNPK